MNLAINKYTTPIHNIIKSAKIMGELRKTEWLFKRASKGYFYQVDAKDAVNFADTMDSMISVLKRNFNDEWDFHLVPVYDESDKFKSFSIHVVLYYPLINITNQNKKSHTIKDLFVTFEIINSGTDDTGRITYSPGALKGTRGFMTYEEWFKGYVHSHLPSDKPHMFEDVFCMGHFCTGSGEINDLQATLRAGYSEGIFELYLLTLETMVSWESIEGTPHNYIEKIGIGTEIEPLNLNSSSYEKYYDFLREYFHSLDVDFVYNEDRYKIKINKKLEDIVKTIIIDKMPNSRKYLIVTRKGTDYYCYDYPNVHTKEALDTMFKHTQKGLPYVIIQNKKIEFKVQEFSGKLPDINNYRVYPKFLEYVSTRLEQELYKKTVRKSTIERFYQSINV